MGGVFWRKGAFRYTLACFRQALFRRKCHPTVADDKQGSISRLVVVVASIFGASACVGVFFVVGNGVSEVAGPSLILSSVIGFCAACIAGMCYTEVVSRSSYVSPYSCLYSSLGEFPAYSTSWLLILACVTAIAGVSRVLSNTIDTLTKNHIRSWVGHYPNLAADPDPLAAAIVVVSGIMVAAGLDESASLTVGLVVSTISAVMLVLFAGISRGEWFVWESQKFMPHNFDGVVLGGALITAVLCSFYLFGIRNKMSVRTGEACCIVNLLSIICCVVVMVSLMFLLHYKLLENTIPLLEVFHTKRIEWGYLGIGVASIFSLSLGLLEWLHPLIKLLKALATDKLLFQILTIDWSFTGTQVYSVLSFILLTTPLAAFLPEMLHIKIFSTCLLCINIIFISTMVYQRYQVQDEVDYQLFGHPRFLCARWSKRKGSRRQIRDKKLKTLEYLKQGMSLSLTTGFTIKNIGEANTFELDTTDLGSTHYDNDRDHLLVRSPTEGNSIDSETEESASGYETDSSSSDTDIDAIVEEYKEKLKVATLTVPSSNRRREPTIVTSKRVAVALLGLFICFACLSIVISWYQYTRTTLAYAGVILLMLSIMLVIFLLFVLISRQPQVMEPSRCGFRIPLTPWIPGFGFLLNVLFLSNVICDTWLWFTVWVVIGLGIYFTYGVRESTADRLALIDSSSLLSPSSAEIHTIETDDRSVTQVDSVLVTR